MRMALNLFEKRVISHAVVIIIPCLLFLVIWCSFERHRHQLSFSGFSHADQMRGWGSRPFFIHWLAATLSLRAMDYDDTNLVLIKSSFNSSSASR